MPQSAYIVPNSHDQLDLNSVKSFLTYYKEITNKTGEQLSWNYGASAFPYNIMDQSTDESDNWFYLKGTTEEYRGMVIGLTKDGIQVVLPDYATHGDKSKANEICKFLAKKINGNLTLFNGRTMYHSKK
ncbi:DUF1885 family protein [Guptibacillus algicola]|uniref:DUF1885 family protein n=1 Tax=Guptibacillus algicola TaxID=225844 RepID=UPI001CD21036|nr:DUF1885 family protein [Alkalihalobacillus algicola]MCA0987910.1 DUF1885 family protein [Alkalihalobacillus algicola]